MQRGLRLPRDLTSRPWVVTARFPVGADGTLGAIEVLGDVADPRVAEAVRRAIRGCAFVPGADAQGRPTRLWAVMPIRFVGR